MARVDVLRVHGRDVSTSTGSVIATVAGDIDRAAVEDPEGTPLLTVEHHVLDPWYARRPSGEAIVRIDNSLNRFHDITYADGRTGRFDSSPVAGSWELLDGTDSRLLVHAVSRGGRLSEWFDWECAQDGTLTLLDFLATVLTYRSVRTARRRHGQSVSVDW